MNILYIPGFSAKNEIEMSTNSLRLEQEGCVVKQVKWNHWVDENTEWNIDIAKARVISAGIENIDCIIAKSIGTFVLVNLLKDTEYSNIKKFIVMGIPVLDLNPEEHKAYAILEDLKDKVVIVHNDKDSHGGLEDLKSVINIQDFKHYVMESDTHIYEYPDLLADILK